MALERIGDSLLLVGTAHVSLDSVKEVERAITEFRPNVVAVELDPKRLEALEDRHKWESTPIHTILKTDRLWLFLTQVLLSSYQRRLGEVYGAEPGAEMLAAVRIAREQGAQVVLADRDIGVTMKRAYRTMRFKEKLRLTWELMKALTGTGGTGQQPAAPEDLTKEDAVTAMMEELGAIAPSIKTVVLDERDEYLAGRIQEASRTTPGVGRKVLAVVGAGHLPGVRKRLQNPPDRIDLAHLENIPKKGFSVAKLLFTWLLPLSILGLFAYFAYQGVTEGNWDRLRNAAATWVLVTGTLAAIGAIIARAHVLSVLTSFIAAPITTLHPALAAGWFAGAVEAWVREPTALDFQNIAKITSAREFFGNRVMRVIMVAAGSNLGAMAGFFLAGALIANDGNVWQVIEGLRWS